MKRIASPFRWLFGVSFYVGEDENKRTPLSLESIEDWKWVTDDNGRVLLAMQCQNDMHMLGIERNVGDGVRLDASFGDWIVTDPLENSIEVVTPEEFDLGFWEVR